ncbi:MAG: CPBP family intramembrane metalloprotease [Lachnospiraceae bacterium]|nr:CPBP family intramembrane metalloprotease [Lachnospiraceae bacterium]
MYELNGKAAVKVRDKELRETLNMVFMYVLITYSLTWLFWYGEFKGFTGLRIVGSFVPSVVGIIFRLKDRNMDKRMFSTKFPPIVIVFVLSYSFLSLAIPNVLARLLGYGTGRFVIHEYVGGIPVYNVFSFFVVFLLVLVAGGPLGEEIGWRGYLMQRLEKSFNPVTAAVLTGICWACWHIPMLVFNVDGYDISFFDYLLQTIILSVITGWVFIRCGRNIIAAILFHTIDNLVLSLCFQPALKTTNLYTVIYWLLQLAVGVFCACDLYLRDEKRS